MGVSSPDSFIEEVTEEVRRDRLFTLFRRYGWIGGLVVVLVVGGTAWTEWRASRDRAEARLFGDAVLFALDAPDPAARRQALAGIAATGERAALVRLLLASDPAEDKAATLAALDAVAADAALPLVWRDLAILRRVGVAGADMPADQRRAALDPLGAPGRPFRPLALELLAYLDIETGAIDAGVAGLTALTQDQESPAGLRRRAQQVVQALGGSRDGA